MISVVICAKNEADRIAGAIAAVQATGEASELIVVDGCSSDATAQIARDSGALVIVSPRPSLARDRQMGADATHGTWVAFVDADHRVTPGDLTRLVAEAQANDYGVLQAGLTIVPDSFWNCAESDFLALTHTPGVKDMVGVAPAVFHRSVFGAVRFDGEQSIDDTDFMYRLHRDTDYRTAISARVTVAQKHDPRFRDYLRKWRWYGRGDGQFMRTHPERAASMRYHLLIRYPILYPLRAVRRGLWRAVPYAIAQGLTRFTYSLTS